MTIDGLVNEAAELRKKKQAKAAARKPGLSELQTRLGWIGLGGLSITVVLAGFNARARIRARAVPDTPLEFQIEDVKTHFLPTTMDLDQDFRELGRYPDSLAEDAVMKMPS